MIRKIKFYFMVVCGLLSLFAPLLPWMSYGVGSKTGIDLGGVPVYIVFIAAVVFLLFTYILYKIKTPQRILLYLTLFFSLILFTIFSFEIIRIEYQTLVAKSLPVEMFGIVTLAADKIHIGYGLWLGGAVSLLASIVSLFAVKIRR